MTRWSAIIAAPAMVTLAIVAPHLVPSLYGMHWTGVVRPLQVLCVAGYLRALYHLGGVIAQSVGRVYSELWRQFFYAAVIVVGAIVGSRFGIVGVAFGVAIAVSFMFVASAQLALRITATSWHRYVSVQLVPLAIAAATGVIALSVRRLFEAGGMTSPAISVGVIAAAALPWSLGVLWMLGGASGEPLRPALPRWSVRFAERLRALVRRRKKRGFAPSFSA
jgi:PST family polysaccharide transporter